MTSASPTKPAANEAGFSLLAVVILLLTLVTGAAALTAALLPARGTAAFKVSAERAALLRTAIKDYKASHGGSTAPSTLAALVATDGTPACDLDNAPASATYLTLQGWCGPYLDQVFAGFLQEYQTDGWGTPFTWTSGTQALTSCGPDRTCGTSDDVTF